MERDLHSWLCANGLERYAGTFRDNAIEIDLLAELTEAAVEADDPACEARALAAWALVDRSETERRAALAEGEAILATGPLFHVTVWFYRDAIEASLAARDWDEAERYAGLLASCQASDPMPWATLLAERGRLLAAAGRGDGDAGIGDAGIGQSLRALRAEFLEIGLRTPVCEIDAAIKAAR